MAILVCLMGFAVAVFSYAATFPGSSNFRSGNWMPGPGFFPQLLATVLFIAAAIELVKAFRVRSHASGENNVERTPLLSRLDSWGARNVAMILVLMFAFPFLLEKIGFAILGFALVFLITWRLKAGLVKSALFAAIAVTLTMVFFRLVFFMDLPQGIWSPTQYIGY